MQISRKDALTDVAQNLPAMASGGEGKPAGTVVSSDGTRVTLGEKPSHTAAIPSPQGGMNTGNEKK
jgi:hypothetical protein